MTNKVTTSFNLLRQFCEEQEFKGYDPYDGLNSKLFRSLPFFSTSRIARLAWIQLFKKSPINFRSVTGVSREYNPKGLGLFLSGYCNLYSMTPKDEYRQRIDFLTHEIASLKSQGWSGDCWGYNFDWQARAFFQPKHTPTVVATTFIAYALLDAYEITKNEELLKSARSACDFILNDLNRTPDEHGNFCFSYSPLDSTQVFNASLLGSRLLARVFSHTREPFLLEAAKRSVQYCVNYQKADGSWSYGTLPFHQWIDNFHTGYNLECLHEYQRYSGDNAFDSHLKKGFDYYINTFFTEEGISKYYSNRIYPIDIHAPAQFLVTLYRLNKLKDHADVVERVLHWTINNMQSEKGYFYFQKGKYFNSKVPYIRWAQGWMFYGLSFYLKARNNDNS